MIVGYTMGVFDMFHVGHLNLLKQAKSLCDVLVVGVTTDKLCVSVKHKTPIISFNDRCAILSGIKYVDYVVAQDTMNKMDAFSKIGFDVMFVGDDWKDTDTWKSIEKQFSELDVNIHYLKYTKGISSTEIRERLKNV